MAQVCVESLLWKWIKYEIDNDIQFPKETHELFALWIMPLKIHQAFCHEVS